jgi:hypothetical protein
MKTPTVTAVCITADRQAYTDRAVQCFLSQTYEDSRMLIYDTGIKPYVMERIATGRIALVRGEDAPRRTIGELRNEASKLTVSDVLIHWDSDDWSAPHRIEDQVKLLINSNADIVGYNDLMFWDALKAEAWQFRQSNHRWPIGTSLCYWRAFWEKHQFQATSSGEDWHFFQGQRTSAMTSMQSYGDDPGQLSAWRPMLVAEIHSKNTHCRITPENTEWKRQTGWDGRLKELMAL